MAGSGCSLEIYRYISYQSAKFVERIKKVVTLGFVYDIEVSNGYAYVAAGSAGLCIIDIRNPYKPKVIGFHDTPGIARNIAVDSKNAYIADGDYGIQIVNIVDPTTPKLIGYYNTPGFCEDVAIKNNLVFIADGNRGLRIVDLKYPLNPKEIGVYETQGYAREIIVSGHYVYLNNENLGLWIFDVKNSKKMCLVAEREIKERSDISFIKYCRENNFPNKAAVLGNNLLCFPTGCGFKIVNLNAQSEPEKIGFLEFENSDNIEINGNIAFVSTYYNLYAIDVSNPYDPMVLSFYDFYTGPIKFSVSGRYAYVAVSNKGLYVLDVADPRKITEISSIELKLENNNITVSGNNIYIADGSSGLRVINASDPKNLKEVGLLKTPGNALDVKIMGNRAYIADGDSGLRIIEIKNPDKMKEIGHLRLPSEARTVNIWKNYAVMATADSGIRLVDIRKDRNPVEIGKYMPSDGDYKIRLHNNYLYVISKWSGVRVLDLNHPANPIAVGEYQPCGYTSNLALSEQYAYLMVDFEDEGRPGMYIIKYNDRLIKSQILEYQVPYMINDKNIFGNHIYLSTNSGDYIVNIANPNQPIEVEAFEIGPESGNIKYDSLNTVCVGEGSTISFYKEDPRVGVVKSSNMIAPTEIRDIVTSGNHAFLIDKENHLHIYDIKNIANIKKICQFNVERYFEYIYFYDGFVYLFSKGLYIVDVNNPRKPKGICYYDTLNFINCFTISGDYAYISNGGNIRIINLKDKKNPKQVSNYFNVGYVMALKAYKERLYIADNDFGLRILNISKPESPIEVGYYKAPFICYDKLEVFEDKIFYVDGKYGLRIFSDETSVKK